MYLARFPVRPEHCGSQKVPSTDHTQPSPGATRAPRRVTTGHTQTQTNNTFFLRAFTHMQGTVSSTRNRQLPWTSLVRTTRLSLATTSMKEVTRLYDPRRRPQYRVCPSNLDLSTRVISPGWRGPLDNPEHRQREIHRCHRPAWRWCQNRWDRPPNVLEDSSRRWS
jgi:hypothetical protein